jgi:uncharacterized protein (UPF0261 family)
VPRGGPRVTAATSAAELLARHSVWGYSSRNVRFRSSIRTDDMPSSILLIGTLDTKGDELAYVRQLIQERGHTVLTMDVGVLADPAVSADISASDVARAGGGSLHDLRQRRDRGDALAVMRTGAEQMAIQLQRDGSVAAVLGLGGSSGTAVATAAMRALPTGLPKLMVSTVASGDVAPYIGVKDIAMMYSVTDIAGLNRLSRRILANAAGAVCGMVEQDAPPGDGDRPMIAATMFGVTTPCVDRVRERLESSGYEVLVFHATGSGGRAMEGLIEDGYFVGVADVTTTEWCDELVGGVLTAGPGRLEAAGRQGIPQVVSCGALDMVNFWARDTVPKQFEDRLLYVHNPNVTLMRTTPEENAALGTVIADKLNRSRGPTRVLLPLRGVSAIDRTGEVFHHPEADHALFDTLREQLRPPVELIELDLHINDPEFADAIAEALLDLLNPTTQSEHS